MMQNQSPGYIALSNWKMYKNHRESLEWIEALGRASLGFLEAVELIVCVPSVHLRATVEASKTFPLISIGAQNVHQKEEGAFTGEISAPMISDAGGRYCMVGHSERRQYFREGDELVNGKTRSLLDNGVSPIVCIGENSFQRESGLTHNQIERQLITCFAKVSEQEICRTVVLYEPIWAVGTGKIATIDQVEEAHHLVRDLLGRMFSPDIADMVRIIYGGSVKGNNVGDLLQVKDVDGMGIGSGSLKVEDFLEIAGICSESRGRKVQ